jgi:long-chain fatty acid transport protein
MPPHAPSDKSIPAKDLTMNVPRGRPRLTLYTALLAFGAVALAPRLAGDELGFHEPSARAAALGGAFTARADDTAALFYNPAGLAFLGELRLKVNLALGRRTLEAVPAGDGRPARSRPNEILAGLAGSWQPVRRVTLAAGYSSPYDYDSAWPDAWPARASAIISRFQAYSFRTALAVEVVKGFAVGAGIDVLSATVAWDHELRFNLENHPLPADVPVRSRSQLSGHGLGWFAGALWKIARAIQIGASFRGPVAIGLGGQNSFDYPSAYGIVPDPYGGQVTVYDLLDWFYQVQPVTGRLTLPQEFSCGLALTPLSRLSFYADLQWTRWSGFGQWAFRSENADGALSQAWSEDYAAFYGTAPDYGTQGVPFALEDTRKIKAGVEFRATKYIALRAGYARHGSAVKAADRTPVYPDLEQSIYSFGLSYEGPVFSIWRSDERIADLSLDVFARLATGGPGESAFSGYEVTYEMKRFVFGVGVGFSF